MNDSKSWSGSAPFPISVGAMCCFLLFFSLMIWSCQKDPDLDRMVNTADNTATTQALLQSKPGGLQLGKQLENPYSLENMRTALANLAKSYPKESAQVTIRATHLYLKVPVADEVELNALDDFEWRNDLDFFDYPLDYEILSYVDGEGTGPGDIYVPRYTSLPVGSPLLSKFPLRYETLAELYLPETDETEDGSFNRFLEELEDEALRITGNQEAEEGGAELRGKFHPKGYIRFETSNGSGSAYEGTPDVKVRARRWFKWRHDYTDNDGYFYMTSTFKKKVRYSVKFKNHRARINNSPIGTWIAKVRGPKKKGSWDHYADHDTKSYLWSAIMRGVYDYDEVLSPTYNIGGAPDHLKIRACPNNDCGVTTMLHANLTDLGSIFGSWLTNDIRIGEKSDVFRIIYKTTIHELGHAAHWNLVGSFTIDSDINIALSHKLVREAWATGIANIGHQDKFGFPLYGDCNPGGIQDMIDDGYPRVLVRDLIDRVDEFRMIPGPGDNYTTEDCDVIDNVDGFTVSQIFNALQGVGAITTNNAMDKWKDNLEDVIPAEAADLQEYYDQWEL